MLYNTELPRTVTDNITVTKRNNMHKSNLVIALSLTLGIISSALFTTSQDLFYLATMVLAVIGGLCGLIMAHDEATELKTRAEFEQRMAEHRNSTADRR